MIVEKITFPIHIHIYQTSKAQNAGHINDHYTAFTAHSCFITLNALNTDLNDLIDIVLDRDEWLEEWASKLKDFAEATHESMCIGITTYTLTKNRETGDYDSELTLDEIWSCAEGLKRHV
jgi:hypothetical protein